MILELAIDSGATLALYKGAGYGLSLIRAALKAKAARSWTATRQRILMLELELEQDLDSDSIEWLLTKKIQSAEPAYLDHLVQGGNGACDVYCQACRKKFKPMEEHKGYWYKFSDESNSNSKMMQTFCNRHLPAVKAVLEAKNGICTNC